MDFISLVLYILVGALWGCTNPILRKGATEESTSTSTTTTTSSDSADSSKASTLYSSFLKFLKIRVWLPYALNQCGSIFFYFLLARADLTMAVPICNALSLVFSCGTSFALGEQVDRPLRAILGSSMVMTGVIICLLSREEENRGKSPMEDEL